jgi:hypothetical protein
MLKVKDMIKVVFRFSDAEKIDMQVIANLF